jgi:hypothetical protein
MAILRNCPPRLGQSLRIVQAHPLSGAADGRAKTPAKVRKWRFCGKGADDFAAISLAIGPQRSPPQLVYAAPHNA